MVEALNAWINLSKAYNTWQSNEKVQKNAMITLNMTTEKVKKGEASKMEQLQIEQQFRTYQTLTMTSKLAYDTAVERFRTVWKFTPKNIDQMPIPVADLLGFIPELGTNIENNTTIFSSILL